MTYCHLRPIEHLFPTTSFSAPPSIAWMSHNFSETLFPVLASVLETLFNLFSCLKVHRAANSKKGELSRSVTEQQKTSHKSMWAMAPRYVRASGRSRLEHLSIWRISLNKSSGKRRNRRKNMFFITKPAFNIYCKRTKGGWNNSRFFFCPVGALTFY